MVSKWLILVGLVFLATFTHLINAQSAKCILHETCGKCLNADDLCSWCIDSDYDMKKPRCFSKSDFSASVCKNKYENRKTNVTLLDDRSTHDFKVGNSEAVQIQPQRAKIILRKGQTKTIKMTYRPAKNYPLDLYYLMDVTISMRDDKATLVSVGKDLAETLQNLTENYRLGFGSFVDKPSMPFMPIGKEENNPCAFEGGVCEKTYGFRHRLSLTENISKFVHNVNATEMSANLDNLEGGLDALMQVLVCGESIGWQNHSRKIVIFATDGLMHFGGDGLLAGVVKKNDKKCHLNDTGDYMASLQMDYPSLEEIYRELLNQKISIIFAVTTDVQQHYRQLHELMPDISRVGILKTDSSNVLKLVTDGYEDFVRKVHFSDNSSEHIQIRYQTTCGERYDEYHDTSTCENAQIGKNFEFLVHVTLLEYPKDESTKRMSGESIRIEEASIGLEHLLVDIEFEDECPCLAEQEGEMASEKCNRNGRLRCGMCECDEGWSGKSCECNMLKYDSHKELLYQCRVPMASNETLGAICSDNGECECGECKCNYGLYGTYCECPLCPRFGGQECGLHAYCECGNCICLEGWSGERCDCALETNTCLAPNTTVPCSGSGECNCGQCQCDGSHFGPFCESSIKDGNSLCTFYEPCAKCLIQQKDGNNCTEEQYDSVCRNNNDDDGGAAAGGLGKEFHFSFVGDIDLSNTTCVTRLTDDQDRSCDYRYAYKFDPTEMRSHLTIKYYKCTHVNVGAAGAIIAGFTFLLGFIVLMAVKVWNGVQDRREYRLFEEERMKETVSGLSPLYNSPTTYYEVPKELRQKEFEMKPI